MFNKIVFLTVSIAILTICAYALIAPEYNDLPNCQNDHDTTITSGKVEIKQYAEILPGFGKMRTDEYKASRIITKGQVKVSTEICRTMELPTFGSQSLPNN